MAGGIMDQPTIVWSGGPAPRSKCVIGLGRDGVINQDIGDYCYRIDDFDPIPGSVDAVATLRQKGYKIVILTDQGGIERGMYTPDQVDAVNTHMLKLFGEAGCAEIDAIYYSASSRKDDTYAKPNTGMFKRCEKEIKDIKFKQGYFVGDKIKDLKAAVNIGAKPILVRTGCGVDTEKELNRYAHKDLKRRTVVYDDLASFVASLD